MTNRKARGDSKLKTLSPEKQELIIGWLQMGTRDSARRKCAEQLGVETSGAALSEFYSWYFLGRQLAVAADFANSIKEDLKGIAGLNINEEQLNLAAQAIFEKQAIEAGDSKLHFKLRFLRQKDRQIELEERKVQLLERRAALAEAAESTVKDKNLTPEQQAERIKQIFGITN